MKIALIAWNVLLTLALAYLFFTTTAKTEKVSSTSKQEEIARHDSSAEGVIAFVNIDSLEKNYNLFAQKRKEMEQKQQQSEAIFNKKMDDFQNSYTAAQQSAATMTQSQLEEAQQKLQQQQMEVQQLQEKLQNDFQKQLGDINKELQDSLDSFIKDFNSAKRYAYIFSYTSGGPILYGEPALNITKEVTDGMNSRMKKK